MKAFVLEKKVQARGEFNGGEITENKPIGFPQDGGYMPPYSNLFYWAHAVAVKDSTIELHPHKGFEIMSFVTKGRISHYDTKSNEWLGLSAGDAQIIRAGSGISHAEKMLEGAEMFQIWFDPGLEISLKKEASYNDYKAAVFPKSKKNGITAKYFIGNGSPVSIDSDVKAVQYEMPAGDYKLEASPDKVYSIYVIGGKAAIDESELKVDDFIRISSTEEIPVRAEENLVLFVIESPEALPYKTCNELKDA